jgi:3-isopropylmalate dehydratase small subunit
MPASIEGSPFSSLTGRAVVAWRDHASSEGLGQGAILIVGPGCWSSASLVLNESGRRTPEIVISADWPDSHGHNPINAGILLVRLPPQTVAELQSMVNSDRGILLTVDICRRDVRVRGRLVGRFEMPPFWCDRLPDGMAGRLLMAQRLLGSADLGGGDRIRLQRRFAAICDAMKAPGAEERRIAPRLDRFLADVAAKSRAGLS